MVKKPRLEQSNLISITEVKRHRSRDAYGREEDTCILPIACPHCGRDIGYLNTETGQYIIDGNYCTYCGQKIR